MNIFLHVVENEKEAFISDLKNLNCSANTIEAYAREIDYFVEFCRGGDIASLRDINKRTLLKALEVREQLSPRHKLSDKTKSCFLNAVRQFLLYMAEDESEQVRATILSSFKRVRIRPHRKVRQYLNENEINQIIHYVENRMRHDKTYITVRDSLLIKFLYYGGMRISEALNVKWEDILESDKAQDMYMIKILGKGKQENYVFIAKDVIKDELDELSRYSFASRADNYIILTKNGNRLNRVEAYIIVSNLMKRAGLDKKGLHIYRHSLGFRLAAEDVPLIDIQEILRHKNINTTRIYVQREETKKLENLRKIYK